MIIVGCGVGGHGAALHARSQGLSCAVLSGGDVGGTCVNRGCVPSKALLAASGRVRDMGDEKHLESMGITRRLKGSAGREQRHTGTGLVEARMPDLRSCVAFLRNPSERVSVSNNTQRTTKVAFT